MAHWFEYDGYYSLNNELGQLCVILRTYLASYVFYYSD